MFYYHGWAVIRYDVYKIGDEPQRQLVGEFRKYLASLSTGIRLLKKDGTTEDIPVTGNCLIVEGLYGGEHFIMTGGHNHRKAYPFEVFTWLAQNGPGSYGVLYVRDDESEEDNEYQVYCLKRGQIDKHPDNLLSPFIPTVEDPFDFDRPDE